MAKILVVDDERAIRNTLKDILEFEGYTIDLAENGKVGLEKALATTYDLIYTDIKMPEMDGLEMLQAYRQAVKENGTEESPVVMISGHGTVETAVEALKAHIAPLKAAPVEFGNVTVKQYTQGNNINFIIEKNRCGFSDKRCVDFMSDCSLQIKKTPEAF